MEPIANGNSFIALVNGYACVTGWNQTLPPLLYPNPVRGLSRELAR